MVYLEKKIAENCLCLKSCQGDLNAAASTVGQMNTLREAVFLTFVLGETKRTFNLTGAVAQSKHTSCTLDEHNDPVCFIRGRGRDRGRETLCSQLSRRHGNTAALSPSGEVCECRCVCLEWGLLSVGASGFSLSLHSSPGDSHQ